MAHTNFGKRKDGKPFVVELGANVCEPSLKQAEYCANQGISGYVSNSERFVGLQPMAYITYKFNSLARAPAEQRWGEKVD